VLCNTDKFFSVNPDISSIHLKPFAQTTEGVRTRPRETEGLDQNAWTTDLRHLAHVSIPVRGFEFKSWQ